MIQIVFRAFNIKNADGARARANVTTGEWSLKTALMSYGTTHYQRILILIFATLLLSLTNNLPLTLSSLFTRKGLGKNHRQYLHKLTTRPTRLGTSWAIFPICLIKYMSGGKCANINKELMS